jgi:hypothetical protein
MESKDSESKDAPLSTTKRRLIEAKRQDYIIEEDVSMRLLLLLST